MLPTTIDFRGFCSSQFPGGRGWEKRLGFKEQSAEKTAREHWVLAKERGCLQTPSGWAATADDLSILGKGVVNESFLYRNCVCSCVCDMCEQ